MQLNKSLDVLQNTDNELICGVLAAQRTAEAPVSKAPSPANARVGPVS